MAIQKKRKSPKVVKPKTRQSSASNGQIDVDKFTKDLRKLVLKHCPDYFAAEGSITTTDPLPSERGFYLLFLDRDDGRPEENRLQALTLGQAMMLDDVTQLFVSVLKRLEKAESLEGIPRA